MMNCIRIRLHCFSRWTELTGLHHLSWWTEPTELHLAELQWTGITKLHEWRKWIAYLSGQYVLVFARRPKSFGLQLHRICWCSPHGLQQFMHDLNVGRGHRRWRFGTKSRLILSTSSNQWCRFLACSSPSPNWGYLEARLIAAIPIHIDQIRGRRWRGEGDTECEDIIMLLPSIGRHRRSLARADHYHRRRLGGEGDATCWHIIVLLPRVGCYRHSLTRADRCHGRRLGGEGDTACGHIVTLLPHANCRRCSFARAVYCRDRRRWGEGDVVRFVGDVGTGSGVYLDLVRLM